jgi:hypothetical protein
MIAAPTEQAVFVAVDAGGDFAVPEPAARDSLHSVPSADDGQAATPARADTDEARAPGDEDAAAAHAALQPAEAPALAPAPSAEPRLPSAAVTGEPATSPAQELPVQSEAQPGPLPDMLPQASPEPLLEVATEPLSEPLTEPEPYDEAAEPLAEPVSEPEPYDEAAAAAWRAEVALNAAALFWLALMAALHCGVLYLAYLVPASLFEYFEHVARWEALAWQLGLTAALAAAVYVYHASPLLWLGLFGAFLITLLLAKL